MLTVDPKLISKLEANKKIPLLSGKESLITVEPTYNLVLNVIRYDDHPRGNDSSCSMNAHIYPLLKDNSKDKCEVAAPVV